MSDARNLKYGRRPKLTIQVSKFNITFDRNVDVMCSYLTYAALKRKYGNIVEQITTNWNRSKD